MTYIPTFLDAAADLKRCFYATYSDKGFDSNNYRAFFNNALQILSNLEDSIESKRLLTIKNCLKKASDKKNTLDHRREDLLMAATLLS